ncbi:P-loop containing nucleoside triphosphate hydrolase protein [Massarina eburnea CBS 473.64]|uniref:RNA helicase n=1 Tax=Massarina eburnea CBS 473.64 TaxID=1395130 RepID=A0A6A6RNB3_9PLEO|nr:P-loop containing nucleoside triphosphate hydrolase protein [Massarina eburnea CBS 473.64]
MAPRRNDDSRSTAYDSRGGGAYSAPRRDGRVDDRRDRNYYRDERTRADEDRRRRDERGGPRGFDDRRRREDRRDDRRDRDTRRRSRSPRRDRPREGSRDARDRRPGRPEYRDRYDTYNPRDNPHDSRRRSDAGLSRDSRSATPGVRPSSRASNRSHLSARDERPKPQLSREERQKFEEARQKEEEEAKKAHRLARMEIWKKQQLAKKQADSPAATSSPAATASPTPVAASLQSKDSESKPEPSAKSSVKNAALKKQKQAKDVFQLDPSAAARPAPFKPATKPNGTTVTKQTGAPSSHGNVANIGNAANGGGFGFKAKAAQDGGPTKKKLLDDGENTGKRSLQPLSLLTPLEVQEPDVVDANGDEGDSPMSDIGSPDEVNNAELQAQLEKRRAEITNDDNQMEDVPTVNEATEAMDVDHAPGAEDVDPLDAYMANLEETRHDAGWAPSGQAVFADDAEPAQTAVEAEDIFALAAAKKKKKEIPVVDHSKVEYDPFRKNFYTEPVEVSQMTPEEVADLRLELDGIVVKPADVPRPVTKWAQMGLLQSTMDVFSNLRYLSPTPIQAQAIPVAESGLDLIGVAKTGSGKTLAFGIPMIRHILDQVTLKPSDGPIGLILAPTRELANQIVNELKPFLKASNLHIAAAYGGAPIAENIAMIKRGNIHVLCATPGRLIDLLQSNSGRVLNFKRVTYVVLDEADRMFDMGFEPQVMKILANVRPDRQGILFSATFPKNMAALARKAFNKPVEITVGGRSVVAPEVVQEIVLVPGTEDVKKNKENKLKELVRQLGLLFHDNENPQVLIFVERQDTAEDVLAHLIKSRYSAVNTIHGAKDQTDRNEAITDFKKGVLPILIATSVAARGLDVPGLDMVINFDCPTHLEDYVHRCGRTGRAGNKGKAITFLENPGQESFAMFLVKALKQSGSEVPEDVQKIAHDFSKNPDAKWYGGFGGKGLEKLDAARQSEKRREKRALKIEGVEDSEEEDLELPSVKKADGGTGAAAAENSNTGLPAFLNILNDRIVVNKSERPEEAGPSKPMTAKERARAAAAKVDSRLSKKGTIHFGQPVDNKGPDAGAFHSTIEINEFPQKARWAVTNRTNVVKILDSTGVSITTKGRSYKPGEALVEGEPKLYVLVEGDTEMAVTDAIMQMHRLLKDATLNAADTVAPHKPTGRYTV